MAELPRLLWGTVVLRPYVFLFLAAYLAVASRHLGWRRAFLFTPLGYALAWLSEFSSIHWGFPYGDYYYIPTTAGKELWVLGVPFMDSLSYVFLCYCAWSTALFILSPSAAGGRGGIFVLETRALRRALPTWLLASFLFVLLDIVIDPVAFQGDRWFLGRIYGYRSPGLYFGIPMSNFAGWLAVGLAMTGALQLLDRAGVLEPRGRAGFRGPGALGPLLYLSVLAFNLWVTFSIGEGLMGAVGAVLVFFSLLFVAFFTWYKLENVPDGALRRHLEDFPHSEARPAAGSSLEAGRAGLAARQ
jgi:putative membrane protein